MSSLKAIYTLFSLLEFGVKGQCWVFRSNLFCIGQTTLSTVAATLPSAAELTLSPAGASCAQSLLHYHQQPSWHWTLQVGIYFFPPPTLVNTFSISEDEKLISYSAHRISLWPCSYLVFRPCILDSRLLSAWSNFREIVFRLSLIWGVYLVRVYSTWLYSLQVN